jgi:hypothetical protein
MTTAEQILDLVNRPPMHPDPVTNRLILLTDIENSIEGSVDRLQNDLDKLRRQVGRY